jgi:hypothetical protein
MDMRLIPFRDEVAEALYIGKGNFLSMARRRADAAVLLAPDSPFYEALVALGREAKAYDAQHPGEFPNSGDGHGYLSWRGITGPLADACLTLEEDA